MGHQGSRIFEIGSVDTPIGETLETIATMRDLELQLRGYRLTTAEFFYHMPDHPTVLQSFLWQQLDLAPGFPALLKFLDFWQREIEGPLHSVKVASAGLIGPAELQVCDGEFRLH